MAGTIEDDVEINRTQQALERLHVNLPGALRYRFANALRHIDQAFALLEVDREMASFRAITAEEEAATALIRSIQLRHYDFAEKFNPRHHHHKAAILACVMGIASTLTPMLKNFQLVFDFSKYRIDVKIPLSNFGIIGGENYAIQFVEPLDLVHARKGIAEENLFTDALKSLAKRSKFEDIKKLVASQANARNTLLYASDHAIPLSKATTQSLRERRNRALTLLTLTVMIWQNKEKQALVRQAIPAFLSVISKLPTADKV